MEKIILTLNSIAPISDEDGKSILSICTTIKLKKGECWLETGKKNKLVGFVDNGFLRKHYSRDGEDVTDFFYFENDLCADLPALITGATSHVNIQALQDTTLTTFPYQAFNELGKTSHAIEHLHRTILEITFLRFYNRVTSFTLLTPKERYDALMVSCPMILQKATQYHIASFLGISPQHLSRLRAQ